MANTNVGISNFVFSQSPFFVRNDHPTFVKFIEAYYQYLEQEGKTIERAKGFRSALDIDRTIDLYSEQLFSQFLHLLPNDILADKNMVVKHIKDFYRAKGSEKSVEFLLSILYDLDTNFYYPKRDILKASDGKWYQEKSLKVFDIQVNNVADPGIFTAKNFTGRQIRGITSNATATVESVDVYYETGVVVKELKVSNQVRDFIAGEKIAATFEEEGLIKDISANVFSGIIVRVDITERGNNYAVGQSIPIESNTGSGGVVIISSVSRAAIKAISVVDGGAGFQNTNLILITGRGTGANGQISLIDADERFHPNTYNIPISLIASEANSIIGNTATNPFETFAYPNMDVVLVTLPPNTSNLTANTISGTLVNNLMFSRAISNSNVFFQTGDSVNVYNTLTSNTYTLRITSSSPDSRSIVFTPLISGNLSFERVVVLKAPFSAWSNLTISCGSGGPNGQVALINLSSRKANSNVFFETFDNIFCFGTNTRIISSNAITNQLIVEPGLPGPLTNQPFQVIKKASRSSTLNDSYLFFQYANTGPIQRVVVLSGGNNYTGLTSLTAEANTRVRNLGILGRMRIVAPGSGYAVGEEIFFEHPPWTEPSYQETLGSGARAHITSVNATGAIQEVKFKEVPGYLIGGSGYNLARLPKANIQTVSGNGGNVIATAVLGDGEILTSTSDDIGAILSVQILSGGSGYLTPPTLNLSQIGSGTAQAVATIVQGVFTYPGRYLNDDGHLSSFNFLQDGRYYHNYSYVVRVKQAINNYRKALKDLVHPSGMSLFGEYIFVDEGDTMNVQVVAANTTGKTIYSLGSYVANLGNIRITKTGHGLVTNNTVYLEFQSGNTINIMNGVFSVVTANANTFFVRQANTVNTSGSVYYGVIQ